MCVFIKKVRFSCKNRVFSCFLELSVWQIHGGGMFLVKRVVWGMFKSGTGLDEEYGFSNEDVTKVVFSCFRVIFGSFSLTKVWWWYVFCKKVVFSCFSGLENGLLSY